MAAAVRSGGDAEDYPTPTWCVDRLLERVWLPNGIWLEPTAGAGQLVDQIRKLRRDVKIVAHDIRPENRATLAKRAHTSVIGDVFAHDFCRYVSPGEPLGARDFRFDVAISNPPYSRAQDVVELCRQLAPWVVMLLRLNWLGSVKRADLFRRDPPTTVAVLPNRPVFRGGHADSCEYGWFVWSPYPSARTDVVWLATTPLAERNGLRQ